MAAVTQQIDSSSSPSVHGSRSTRPGLSSIQKHLCTNYSSPFLPAQPQTVFARLQALFPASPAAATSTNAPQEESSPVKKPPNFIKVHIVTWNMHDSLPKVRIDGLREAFLEPDLDTGRPERVAWCRQFACLPA